jgi:hypothetical protein
MNLLTYELKVVWEVDKLTSRQVDESGLPFVDLTLGSLLVNLSTRHYLLTIIIFHFLMSNHVVVRCHAVHLTE